MSYGLQVLGNDAGGNFLVTDTEKNLQNLVIVAQGSGSSVSLGSAFTEGDIVFVKNPQFSTISGEVGGVPKAPYDIVFCEIDANGLVEFKGISITTYTDPNSGAGYASSTRFHVEFDSTTVVDYFIVRDAKTVMASGQATSGNYGMQIRTSGDLIAFDTRAFTINNSFNIVSVLPSTTEISVGTGSTKPQLTITPDSYINLDWTTSVLPSSVAASGLQFNSDDTRVSYIDADLDNYWGRIFYDFNYHVLFNATLRSEVGANEGGTGSGGQTSTLTYTPPASELEFIGNYTSEVDYTGVYTNNEVAYAGTYTNDEITREKTSTRTDVDYIQYYTRGESYSRDYTRDNVVYTGVYTNDAIARESASVRYNVAYTGNYTGTSAYIGTYARPGTFSRTTYTAAPDYTRMRFSIDGRLAYFSRTIYYTGPASEYARDNVNRTAVDNSTVPFARYYTRTLYFAGAGVAEYTRDRSSAFNYTAAASVVTSYVTRYTFGGDDGGFPEPVEYSRYYTAPTRYTTAYYTGNYSRGLTYTRVSSYTRAFSRVVAYTGDFIGTQGFIRYQRSSKLSTYSRMYTGANDVDGGEVPFIGNYTGVSTFTGNYAGQRTIDKYFTGAKDYIGDYVGAGYYIGTYIGNSTYTGYYTGTGAFSRNFSRDAPYSRYFVGTGNYIGNYVGNSTYTGYYAGTSTYTGYYTGTSTYTRTSTRTSTFTPTFTPTYTAPPVTYTAPTYTAPPPSFTAPPPGGQIQ